MIMAMWAVIVVAVLVSALLIYMEHEWGVVLGGATAAILVVSYFSAGLVLRSPLVILMPQASSLDAMAITAGVLLVLALVAIAYRAGRRKGSTKKP